MPKVFCIDYLNKKNIIHSKLIFLIKEHYE